MNHIMNNSDDSRYGDTMLGTPKQVDGEIRVNLILINKFN